MRAGRTKVELILGEIWLRISNLICRNLLCYPIGDIGCLLTRFYLCLDIGIVLPGILKNRNGSRVLCCTI